MAKLTELQLRCLSILQRRSVAHGRAAGVKVGSLAWEMNKTSAQTGGCLQRLRNKGLVECTGAGHWCLTMEGHCHALPMPPGE